MHRIDAEPQRQSVNQLLDLDGNVAAHSAGQLRSATVRTAPGAISDQRFRYGPLKNPTAKDADTPSPATMITICGPAVPRVVPASKAEAG